MSDPLPPPPPPSDPIPPTIPPIPPEEEPAAGHAGFFRSPTTPFPSCGPGERSWAVGIHASAFVGGVFWLFGNILGPLIVWLIKRPESKYLDEVGKEAVNFQISLAIYFLVALVPAFLLSCLIIPIVLPFAVGIAGIVLVIIAIVKTSDGSDYRYPATIRFIK